MPVIDEILDGRYQIKRQLGLGGMGAVYKAIDTKRFGKPVALKEIRIDVTKAPTHKQQEIFKQAFEREAKILTQLDFEAFPQVVDYFTEEDRQYLVMELIQGDDLEKQLRTRQKPFALDKVLNFADQLLDALDYLHTLKPPIIHRDIKPQNLKLTPRGKIKLLDFGIAKGSDAQANFTITNQTFLAATLHYSPIEQILRVLDPSFLKALMPTYGEKISKSLNFATDASGDIYALGATLYHLLTNVLPVDALKRALELWVDSPDPLPAPSHLISTVPPEVSDWILKAMEIDRERRFASAEEMRSALHQILKAEKLREEEAKKEEWLREQEWIKNQERLKEQQWLREQEKLKEQKRLEAEEKLRREREELEIERRNIEETHIANLKQIEEAQFLNLKQIEEAKNRAEVEIKRKQASAPIIKPVKPLLPSESSEVPDTEPSFPDQEVADTEPPFPNPFITNLQSTQNPITGSEQNNYTQISTSDIVTGPAYLEGVNLTPSASEGSISPEVSLQDQDQKNGSKNINYTFSILENGHDTDLTEPNKLKWLIAASIGLVALLFIVFLGTKIGTSPLSGIVSNNPSQSPQKTALNTPPAPAGMVFVPGGEFIMGRNDTKNDVEKPAHTVSVNPFFIDQTEVTNKQYAEFVKAANYRLPSEWKNGTFPKGQEDFPVVGVNWDDANAYASWAGKRLPTEEEWEFAAKGKTNFLYPWGNEWQISKSVTKSFNKVGSFSEKSPFGLYDMVGNAWEWTASDFNAYPNGTLPEVFKGKSNLKTIRGGSFDSGKEYSTTTYRIGWVGTGADNYKRTGFRCVKDISK